jgi:hypothetical protein
LNDTTTAPLPPYTTVGVSSALTPGVIETELAETVLLVLFPEGITVNV